MQKITEKMRLILSMALEKDKEFMKSINFSHKFEDLEKEFIISFEEEINHIVFDFAPRAGIMYDLSLSINKKTGSIIQEDIVIGEIEPEPE